MDRIGVYEYVTAMADLGDSSGPAFGVSLLTEGKAMRDAMLADLPGAVKLTRIDAKSLKQVDAVLLIAPETDGLLTELAERVRANNKKLLGPEPEAIRLTSDKRAFADYLTEQGIRTPRTLGFDGPIVVKPRDGAGSEGVRKYANVIVQEFVPGRALSIAVLCGPAGVYPLVTCEQTLSDDGTFRYLGGKLPIEPEIDQAVRAWIGPIAGRIPGLLGYVGFDVVWNDSGPTLIECNPRLTTSYLGLRALCETNLATAMVAVRHGEMPAITWKPGPVVFRN